MSCRLRHIILLLVALIGATGAVYAQSDAQMTQYFEVPSYYNSGALGSTDLLKIRGGMRMQWVGIHGAPRSFVATAEMPVRLFGKRLGVGLVAEQEGIGLYKNFNLAAQVAYQQPLFKGRLSIGVGVGFIDQSFKGSEVYLPDEDDYHQGTDDGIPTNDIKGTALDVSLGAFYTHKLFWAGISVNHLNSPVIRLDSESGQGGTEDNYEFQIGRAAYFMAGSNIAIKNTLLEVMPSVMVKTDFQFTTAEVTARVRYNKFLTAGLGYRWKDALMVILGAEIKGFFIGYAYDYPTSAIIKGSSGSHEVIAGYSLKLDFSEKNKNKHKSIRIM